MLGESSDCYFQSCTTLLIHAYLSLLNLWLHKINHCITWTRACVVFDLLQSWFVVVLSFPSDYNYGHINLVHLSYFYIEKLY